MSNETMADIIDEIHRLADTISDGIIAINGKVLASRLEAAAKREASMQKSENCIDGNAEAARHKCPTALLSLDEAIAHAEECANDTPCGKNHRQLADWLKELRSLRHCNAAAMREALMKIYNLAQCVCDDRDEPSLERHHGNRIQRLVNAALSSPSRNCDVYTHDEALRIWAAEKENDENGCFDEWLYAPTERKGKAE